jgi:uncharacterized protein YndB with AHSA1/START domain
VIKTTDSVYVDAPVNEVYEYFSDPTKWPELAPPWGHMECTNLKRTPELTGTTFDGTAKFFGLPPMSESFEILEAKRNRRLVLRGDGPFGEEIMTLLFEPVDAGMVVTMLDERGETTAERIPVFGRLVEAFVNRTNAVWLHQLKVRMEARPRGRAA